MSPLGPVPLPEIQAAHERLRDTVVRTPLVPLNLEKTPAEIYLKLELLQPVGSFKMRGLGNAVLQAVARGVEERLWTVSAGNAAQALAWYARHVGLPCSVLVPETAPETKLAGLQRLGAEIVPVSVEEFFRVAETQSHASIQGHFIHPFADPEVMAGNGTIGLEILEDLGAPAAVVVPYGGGGLSCGIASAFRSLAPQVRTYGSEVETATPLDASWRAGRPQEVERVPSFVDGIGAPRMFSPMWAVTRELLAGAIVVPLAEVVRAIRLLLERHRVVAEGAAATSLAAALAGGIEGTPVVCVVSGGNLDRTSLEAILGGAIPAAPSGSSGKGRD